MKKYSEKIKESLHKELTKSALDYFNLGLSIFHEARKQNRIGIQPPIGILGISIELMIKSFLIQQNPTLIFCTLPKELSLLFTCPDFDDKKFNWRHYDIDLRSFSYKTIDFSECVSYFYTFFKDLKQILKPYFRVLSESRNKSIHASLPSFQLYDLERMAFLAISVFNTLNNNSAFGSHVYSLKKEDQNFIKSFLADRTDRVKKKIEDAKENSKKLTGNESHIVLEPKEWDLYVTSCPICQNDGYLCGDTEFEADGVSEEAVEYWLDFNAFSFECDECGLKLDDIKELEMVGIETNYDRETELEDWFEDHYEDYPSEYF